MNDPQATLQYGLVLAQTNQAITPPGFAKTHSLAADYRDWRNNFI